MAGSNTRTSILDLGPSRGGIGSNRPTISDAVSSDMILANAALFGVSAAFFCKTKTTGLAGNTVSMWNGDDLTDAGWGTGEAWVQPNPIMPTDATHSNIITTLTRIYTTGLPGGVPAFGDHWHLEALGGAGSYTTALKFIWLNGSNTALDIQVWFTVMVISPRRAVDSSTFPQSARLAKEAMFGGVPSVPANVFPQ